MWDKLSTKVVAIAALLAAVSTITLSPYRIALKVDVDAVAATIQTHLCVGKVDQLNNAYHRRDDYINSGRPIPDWLSAQIAELEVYIRANC